MTTPNWFDTVDAAADRVGREPYSVHGEDASLLVRGYRESVALLRGVRTENETLRRQQPADSIPDAVMELLVVIAKASPATTPLPVLEAAVRVHSECPHVWADLCAHIDKERTR